MSSGVRLQPLSTRKIRTLFTIIMPQRRVSVGDVRGILSVKQRIPQKIREDKMMGLNRETSATKGRLLACLAGALAAGLAMAGPTLADYKITSIISLPGGQKITSFDIVVTEPTLSLLAFTDRAQKGIDVFDTTTNTLLFESGGFIGLAGATDAGPNGVIFVGAAKSGSGHLEIWAGDGNGTLKVVDFTTKSVIKTIASGGSAL